MISGLHSFFVNDPFVEFYNLSGLDTVLLTTDIDWAPEYMIEDLFELVGRYGFKLTAFGTHASEVMKTAGDMVEVGLHPNYCGLRSGDTIDNKLRYLKAVFPEAVGLRCHRNFFGNNVSDMAKELGLSYDVSTVLWKQPFAQAYADYNDLVRMAYVWEDGLHADMKLPMNIEEVPLDEPGLKILNVHPVLIYLNASDDNQRRAVTKQYTDLTQAKKEDVDSYVHQGYGMKSFYEDILTELKRRRVKTVFCKDVAQVYNGN